MIKKKEYDSNPMRKRDKYKVALCVFCWVVAIVLLLVFNFSTFYLSQEDFVGTYKSEYVGLSREIRKDPKIKNGIYNNGTYWLDLRSDGTFKYQYISIHGEKKGYSGTWEYRRLAGHKQMILYGYALISDKPATYPLIFDEPDPDSFCPLSVKKRGKGKLMIPLCPERYLWFVKQSGKK